jgi:hypothetical protein
MRLLKVSANDHACQYTDNEEEESDISPKDGKQSHHGKENQPGDLYPDQLKCLACSIAL